MTLSILDWSQLNEIQRTAALARAAGSDTNVKDNMRKIVDDVRTGGDEAVLRYATQFDKYQGPLAPVPVQELKEAVAKLSPELRKAMELAITNLIAFHSAQKPTPIKIQTMPGVECEFYWRPLERVGLYIPAGTAPLFSALMMVAVPSGVAGCKTRYLCSPTRKDGKVDPTILAAAALCGLDTVYPVGGPWSIAAMAYGTQSMPKVDKIYGAGNAYVTAAKQLVAEDSNGAAIDMPAGPSEVMVLADGEANPVWVAADLLAQAEHGTDSQAVLVTTSRTLAEKVAQEVDRQLKDLSRAEITAKALEWARLIVVPTIDEGVAVACRYAPEHLIVQGAEGASWPTAIAARVPQAASVFVGPFSPETAGDYASGTNHILPTYGYARAYSGLSLLSFMKSQSVQTLTREGLDRLAPSLIAMAKAEGLDAHAAAVEKRIAR